MPFQLNVSDTKKLDLSGRHPYSTGLVEDAEYSLQSAGAHRLLGWIEEAALGSIEVELKQEANAVSAAALVANSIDSVGVSDEKLPGFFRRAIAYTATHA